MKKVIVDKSPKRPRFQFSLRTMLIAIVGLCLLLGLVVVPAARQVTLQKETGRLLQQARSKIEALATRPPNDIPEDQWRQAVQWTSNVVNEIFENPIHRNLNVLRALCEGLDEKVVGEADLATLQWVWELCEQAEPDGEDLTFRLQDVRVLNAGPITDDRLPGLWALDKCTFLDLSGTQVTDAGLLHLAELDRLSSLVLNDTRITDSGIRHLRHLENLSCVWLNNDYITDDGLSDLQQLENLVYLFMEGTQVGDEGITHLQELTRLRYLGLSGTQFTQEGIERLRQALPDCDVTY